MREEIYQNIKNGIWPKEVNLVSSTYKGDVYKIKTAKGDMYVRVFRDVQGKEKVTWVS